MNPPDEAEAWRRAVAGDGAAFGALFDEHHRRVYRHARALTNGVHDAEDVTAAAFLELWRRRKKVRVVDGSVLPWLLVTTTNLALNHGRGVRRHRAFIERLPRSPERPEPTEPAPLGLELDLDPELLARIRRLRGIDQQLLALVALEGYRLAEAASALGMSDQAARSRWQRIRRRLDPDRPSTVSAVALEH